MKLKSTPDIKNWYEIIINIGVKVIYEYDRFLFFVYMNYIVSLKFDYFDYTMRII